MLYCLTRDVYNDLMAMQMHLSAKYDTTNCKYLDIIPHNVRLCKTESLIFKAVSKLYNNGDYYNHHLIIRNWCSTIHPFTSDTTDMHFQYPENDIGFWEYTYVALGAKKVFISNTMYSKYISVNGGVPYYRIDDGLSEKEYTLAEIAASNQKFKLDAVFPAEPNMFSETNLEYMIPYSLII
ncbi:hypothetical protein SEPL_290 [Salmonella phage SE_PL]|nr:hypothetical protein CPT_Munch_135 [Salmonella phage Munch]QCW18815.1 hypothetical protein 7t3_0294 [Salmonella phage 7t3]QIG62903.1 hypothetical protein SEPL_290 [Salmonella phage SE_PL]